MRKTLVVTTTALGLLISSAALAQVPAQGSDLEQQAQNHMGLAQVLFQLGQREQSLAQAQQQMAKLQGDIKTFCNFAQTKSISWDVRSGFNELCPEAAKPPTLPPTKPPASTPVKR